jgi:hypothetical protein
MGTILRQRLKPFLKLRGEPMTPRSPIGFEARGCRKIDRGLFDIVPMLGIELSVPPLEARTLEEA